MNGTTTLGDGATLNLAGGDFTDSGVLAGSGTFLWTGGYLGGSGTTTIASTVVVNIGGSGDGEYLGDGSSAAHGLINNGTANLTGGDLYIYDANGGTSGSVLVNSGTFNAIGNNGILQIYQGAQGNFTNSAGAIFNKTGDGTTTSVNVAFNNAGTVSVTSGTLALNNGGAATGSFVTSPAAMLQFNGGAYTLNPGSAFSGSGVVELTGATLLVDAPVSAVYFRQSGGTLSGTGALTITNEYDWTGGYMGGSGTTTIASTAVVNIGGSGNAEYLGDGSSGRTLVNNGTANLSDPTGYGFTIYGNGYQSAPAPGSVFVNNGTFNATDNAGILEPSYYYYYTTQSSFTNSPGAIFNKTGDGTTTSVNVAFNNAGTVSVTSGTLALNNGGAATGSFVTSPAAMLQFNGGAYTLNPGSAFSGSGVVQLTGATLLVDAPVSAVYFQESGGTLSGTGALTITNEYDWTGGYMGGSGTTTIASTAVVNIGGSGAAEYLGDGNSSRTLVNNGTANLSDPTGNGLTIYGNGYQSAPAPGSVFVNNGTFNATGNAGIQEPYNYYYYATQGSFTNSPGAIFNKAGDGTTTSVSVAFNNAGTVSVTSGTLALNNGGTATGSFVTSPAAMLQFNGGAYTLNPGSAFSGSGAVQLTGATLLVDAPVSAVYFQQSGGTLSGTGALTINNEYDWTGGYMGGSGTTTIPSTATLNIGGSSNSNFQYLGDGDSGRTLVNNGTANLSGSAGYGLVIYGNGYYSSPAPGSVFVNNGTFNATDNAGILEPNNYYSYSTQGSFTNSPGAIFNKTGDGTTTPVNVAFNNAGNLNVTSGTLAFNSSFTQSAGQTILAGGNISGNTLTFNGGSLAGSGTVSAAITMNTGSLLAPGLSSSTPQVITEQGNLTFNAGSRFQVQLQGAGLSDSINVMGNAVLNGVLSFLVDGDVPEYDQSYRIANISGTRTGSFGLTDGEYVGDGLSISFDGGNGHEVDLISGVPSDAAPIATASSSQPAYIDSTYSSPNTGITITYQSLTVEPGDTATLGPEDTLVLTNGPLVIAPGAIFTGDGTVDGNVINYGLVRIPIVRIGSLSDFSGPGRFFPIPPPTPGPTPVPVPAPIVVGPGTTIDFGDEGGDTGWGGDSIGASGSNGGTVIFPRPGPQPSPSPGEQVAYVANLAITGSFEQATTGTLRLFIGGSEKGVSYSHLDVGGPVSLDGGIELVLEPDLFNFLPAFGETFDLIDSPDGITIPDSLTLSDFVTQSGASYLPDLTLTPYDSGILGDPDQLDQIGQTVFTYSLVDNGTELQATYVGPVPEPSTWALLITGAAGLLAFRRSRRRSRPIRESVST
jgi:hypothetical protein